MFNKEELLRLRPLIYFFIGFTIFFLLFAVTLKYTFPFLAGFLLALMIQPLMRFLKKKLKFRSAAAAALSTLAVYAVVLFLLTLLGVWLITELNNLLYYISTVDFSRLTAPLNSLIGQFGEYISRIDKNFIQENQEQIMGLARSGAGIVTTVLTGALSFLTSLPAIFTMILVMVFSTYFFSKDMSHIKNHVMGLFSNTMADNIHRASQHGINLSGKYLASYFFIYFITFLETLVVFLVLNVPYPLVLSIVTGVADILPVLGPGAMYIPLTLLALINGQWFQASALLISWLLITAIRQIIEPKIVSASINIHPLTMLAAIYFALAAGSFVLLIYFSALLLLYQILTQTGILPRIFHKDDNSPAQENKNETGAHPSEN